MDYYSVLGLEQGATLDEIKKSYRNLVLRYHPDRSRDPDSTNQFIKINDAYEALCKEITGTIQPDEVGLLIRPGKVIIASPGQDSYVEIRQGRAYLYGYFQIKRR